MLHPKSLYGFLPSSDAIRIQVKRTATADIARKFDHAGRYRSQSQHGTDYRFSSSNLVSRLRRKARDITAKED
jgi:hypothetical protein